MQNRGKTGDFLDKNTLVAIRYVIFAVLVLAVILFPNNLGTQASAFIGFLAGIILPAKNAAAIAARFIAPSATK